ncbi:SusC/RagA family TonB-linked outer membrane protein [Pedobacter endophyticus]|uniref:SusC/RagA family TonB-linked outer membrane protein n=1 Tax=Pedobacter endophyticus TaxID=2789740 RepID=A0A7U3SNV8_9SPHI|nr:SusC/RagA family TonB-linked outer membrane protein [Pedobacter endophyticus]QPH37923.1 SusC/RagA family TonB-linked outer membrane protein [Pedobacter endophyticus]
MKKNLLIFIFFLCAFLSFDGYGQTQKITGKVLDNEGLAIPNVSIVIQGSSTSSQTDLYGNFSLSADKGATLIFKSLGFQDQTVVVGDQARYTVKLQDAVRNLDEVVVVGYGSLKKEAITGSVSSITAADIEKRPVTNALVALEGSAPGLQINNSYGEPGSAPSIRIRGYGSINGTSTPLIVLDNVVYTGSVNDINPNDIESISVLKDATSSSLYGSKGSNGVILITTKKGKNGKSTLNLNVNQGLYTRGIPEYDKVTPQEYMGVEFLGYRNQLLTANPTLTVAQANATVNANLVPTILRTNIFNLPDNQLFDANGNLLPNAQIKGSYAEDLDWFDAISRNGYRQDYNLSGQAGNEKSNLFYSAGYLDEQGYIKTSDFERFTGRVSGSISPRSWIKAGFSLNGNYQVSNNTTGSGSGFTTPWNYARNIAPIYPIHEHNLTTGDYILDATGNRIYDGGANSRTQYVNRHIIWENELNMDRTYQNSLISQGYVDINFLKDFKFSTIASNSLRNSEQRTYNNAIIGDGAGNKGRGSRTIYRRNELTLQQQLTYKKSINDHNFDFLVGHESYFYRYNYLYGYKTTETFAGQVDLVNFTQITNLTDYEHNDRTESLLSRLRYNYKEKYFVEGSFRRDGTSRLHPEHRWGNFWSVGGTWLVSKEDFFSSISDYVNDLKIRGSYGKVGNIASVDLYGYLPLYTIGQNNNIAALYKSQNEARDLQWEGQRATSIALEGRFFKRLNLTVEYFDKGSDGLIFDVNLPLSAGATSTTSAVSTITKNIGKVKNSGIELSADVDIIKNSEFKWNFGANATFLKNKIVALPEENRANGILSNPFKYMEGHSVYDYFLYQYAGVDMMTGQALYYADDATYSPTNTTGAHYQFLVNVNGTNYTRNAAYAKRDWSGSGVPDVMGSFNTSFDYKGFSLSALFNYSIGGKGFDYSYIGLMSVTATPSAVHKDVLNSWNGIPEGMTLTSPNRINPDATPQINFTNSQYNNSSVSTRFLQNNSYFVIKNIALGYTVPQSVTRKLDLSRLSFSFLVDNLATFTGMKGYSPQQTFGGYSENEFVPARTFSLGINIGL